MRSLVSEIWTGVVLVCNPDQLHRKGEILQLPLLQYHYLYGVAIGVQPGSAPHQLVVLSTEVGLSPYLGIQARGVWPSFARPSICLCQVVPAMNDERLGT